MEMLKCVTIKPKPANNPANKVSLKFNSAAASCCLFNDTVITAQRAACKCRLSGFQVPDVQPLPLDWTIKIK